MKNNNFGRAFLIAVMLFSNSLPIGIAQGDAFLYSHDLIQFIARHKKHDELDRSKFNQELSDHTLRREQLAQFLVDRAYIYKNLEDRLLIRNLHFNQWKKLEPEEKILYRSVTYEMALDNLVGRGVHVNPSPSAEEYVEHLKQSVGITPAVHHAVLLLGEGFGGAKISSNFSETMQNHALGKCLKRYERVGDHLKNFEGFTPREVIQIYKKFIDRSYFSGLKSMNTQQKDEAELCLSRVLSLFDTALEADRVSLDVSAVIHLSKMFDFMTCRR